MTREQLLVAMALLEISVVDFADAIGVSERTAKRMRKGEGASGPGWDKARWWFETQDIDFIAPTRTHGPTAALRRTP